MGTKKRKPKGELIDMEEENPGMIESTIFLQELKLKDKRWSAKMLIGTILPKSYHRYQVKMELDESPYLDRIAELEKGLDDSLFREEKGSVRETNKRIGQIRDELKKMKESCVTIEFGAIVEEVKYKDSETLLTARIPDDIIQDLNEQKFRLEAYKIALIPTYGAE